MPFDAEARYKGGLVTLERHGREHYARITPGGKRRGRYTPTAGRLAPSAAHEKEQKA